MAEQTKTQTAPVVKQAPAKTGVDAPIPTAAQSKAKVRTPKVAAPKETAKQMATPKPVLEMHNGKTPSSFRTGKKLTPLRHDYRVGQMSQYDEGFLRDCLSIAGPNGKFPRLNADAGRLGRLYTLEFVKYDETGVASRDQIITLTSKAHNFVKAVTATPTATKVAKSA